MYRLLPPTKRSEDSVPFTQAFQNLGIARDDSNDFFSEEEISKRVQREVLHYIDSTTLRGTCHLGEASSLDKIGVLASRLTEKLSDIVMNNPKEDRVDQAIARLSKDVEYRHDQEEIYFNHVLPHLRLFYENKAAYHANPPIHL